MLFIATHGPTQVMYDELEIGDVIGKGSTGVVIAAKHKPTGTHLALKVRPTAISDAHLLLFYTAPSHMGTTPRAGGEL
jgi:hypothetical protein